MKLFLESQEIQEALAGELPLAASWGVFLFFGAKHPEILWVFGVPVVVAGFFCGYRLLREHIYIEVPDRLLPSLFASTRDHSLGWASRAFLAPRNIGYHLVHHIHPQVGLVGLPALTAWYQEALPEHYPAS